MRLSFKVLYWFVYWFLRFRAFGLRLKALGFYCVWVQADLRNGARVPYLSLVFRRKYSYIYILPADDLGPRGPNDIRRTIWKWPKSCSLYNTQFTEHPEDTWKKTREIGTRYLQETGKTCVHHPLSKISKHDDLGHPLIFNPLKLPKSSSSTLSG